MTTKTPASPEAPEPVQMHLPDNRLAQALFGPHNVHLDRIGERLEVHITARGNHVTIKRERAKDAKALPDVFYSRLVNGGEVELREIETTLLQGGAVGQR